ncbi:MAG: TonB-dependent receptor [Planctomycetota bacterium]|jgi:outer membrane receptor protein involved in Fe transport|nr:TonB-dependent receptor [Planctomycetota bacterium]MDP6763481.1 TonB-dependent receptor [Planctomycetota bacterium]MDP6990849.1 TonB-dependent receptor [Planctomycetota bacterium]
MFLTALTLAFPVSAQEVELPTTLVTAPRSEEAVTTTSAKLTVVSGEELAATGERSLPRAISRATGVWVQETNLGGGAPIVRGLVGNKILILVDGVRLNDSTTRFGPNQSLNSIDPATVERVEVLRGSASVLYGSDAIGGVISIWTRRVHPTGDGEAPLLYGGAVEGSWTSAADALQGSLTGTLRGEKDGVIAVGSFHDFGDLTAGGGDEIPFTGYHGNSFFAAWEHDLGRGRDLSLSTRIHRDFDVPRTDKLIVGFGQTTPKNELYDYSLQDRMGTVLAYTDESGGFWDRFQARISVRSYREEREKRKTGSDTLAFEVDEVNTGGLGADWRKAVGEDHLLLVGFDVDHDDVDSSRVDTDLTTGEATERSGSFAPGARYTSSGVFVQDEVLTFDPWFLTLGVRYSAFFFEFDDFDSGERVSDEFDALTASAEVAREVAEGITAVGTLSQGFRAPNLEDLANNDEFAGGEELANPDLDPEESVTAELALEIDRSPWQASVAAFYSDMDGFIGRRLLDEGDPDEAGDETWLRDNVGTMQIWGMEGSVRRKLPGPDSPFGVEAAASLARGRQHDPTVDPETGQAPLDGVDARRIPPLFGHLALDWDAPEPDRRIGWARLSWLWADGQDRLHPSDVSDPRIDPEGTPGWNTWNLDFGGETGFGADWWIGFHNILDRRYRVHASGFDAPGFSVVLGMRAAF